MCALRKIIFERLISHRPSMNSTYTVLHVCVSTVHNTLIIQVYIHSYCLYIMFVHTYVCTVANDNVVTMYCRPTAQPREDAGIITTL